MHKHLEKICDMKHKLIEAAECEIAKGLDCVSTHELGEVVDMIKDLCEAEEKCVKAAYYDAMIGEDGEPEESKMGYNPRRYASGRYAPKGAGHMGYIPMQGRMMDEPEHMSRMGYYPSGAGNRSQSGSRMGYIEGPYDRYGRPYNEYRNAKRHYTETHSESDKQRMHEHANEHVSDTIASMRAIWQDLDHDQKVRVKQDFTNLLSEMTV